MNDSSRFSLLRNSLLLMGALVLTACGGGGGARSPDLPFPESKLIGFDISCTRVGSMIAGESTQCSIRQCVYLNTASNGQETSAPGACPTDFNWTTSPETLGTASPASGAVTTITTNVDGSGTLTVTATGPNNTSNSETFTVEARCATSIRLEPASDTVVAGLTSREFRALADFNNGGRNIDVTNNTTYTLEPQSAGTFTDRRAVQTTDTITTQTVATVRASYSSACSGTLPPATAELTITPASVLADGLCLEPADQDPFPTGRTCRASTPATACAATPDLVELTSGQTRQLRLRARLDNNTECLVTNQNGAAMTSDDGRIATVTNSDATGRGLVRGVSRGETRIQGEYTLRGVTSEALPVPVKVNPSEVLGANSLGVAAKSLSLIHI